MIAVTAPVALTRARYGLGSVSTSPPGRGAGDEQIAVGLDGEVVEVGVLDAGLQDDAVAAAEGAVELAVRAEPRDEELGLAARAVAVAGDDDPPVGEDRRGVEPGLRDGQLDDAVTAAERRVGIAETRVGARGGERREGERGGRAGESSGGGGSWHPCHQT